MRQRRRRPFPTRRENTEPVSVLLGTLTDLAEPPTFGAVRDLPGRQPYSEDHDRRYRIPSQPHPPGPPIDVLLLTDRHLLAPALRTHLTLTPTALDHLDAALTYAASGHLGFPHLDTLTTAGLLTRDEADLWRLIAHGTPNHHIASTLGYSPRTLSRHLPAFYQLIGAADKPHATRLCTRALPPHTHPAPGGHNTIEKYR